MVFRGVLALPCAFATRDAAKVSTGFGTIGLGRSSRRSGPLRCPSRINGMLCIRDAAWMQRDSRRAQRCPTFDDPLEFVSVSREEARKAFVGEKKPVAGTVTARGSPRQSAEGITDMTRAWLESLPFSVRPWRSRASIRASPTASPSCGSNRASATPISRACWSTSAAAARVFTQSVALELVTLKTHYQTVVYPLNRTVWDGNRF